MLELHDHRHVRDARARLQTGRTSSAIVAIMQVTLTVVVLASLPTAQNVFNFAQRFGVAETVARDTVFLTTIGCIPVLIGALVLFG